MKGKTERLELRAFYSTEFYKAEVAFALLDYTLKVGFHLKGEMDQLEGQPPSSGRLDLERGEELWLTTCFELFLKQGCSYFEYNLSPENHWNAYKFTSYRGGMTPLSDKFAPRLIMNRKWETGWDFTFSIDMRPFKFTKGEVYFSPALILKDQRVTHYFSHTHPSDVPDFHHDKNFIHSLVVP